MAKKNATREGNTFFNTYSILLYNIFILDDKYTECFIGSHYIWKVEGVCLFKILTMSNVLYYTENLIYLNVK